MKTTHEEMKPLYDVSPDDAIGMLIADHKRVANLFADFKRMTDEGQDRDKASVVMQICRELTVHTQLEEELFYPAVRKAIDDDDQVDEAVVEHAAAKQLIAQLEAASPDDELYDAKVTVLGEQIDHHVEEEEGSLFPKARYSGLDTIELGAAMLTRKSQIMSGEGATASPPMPDVDAQDDDIVAQKRVAAPSKSRAAVRKPSPPVKSKATKSVKKKRR